MKKVIIAVPYLSGRGGTETVIKNLNEAVEAISGTDEWNWKLVSFGGSMDSAWMKKWEKKVYNFTNFRAIQKILYITLLPALILRTLIEEKPEFFVATNPVIWTVAYIEKKLFRFQVKIVAWYHFSFKKKKVKKLFLNFADCFWAISSGIKNELLSLGVPSFKIKLIYNPVNIEKTQRIRRSGLQNHFIYIGRVDYDGQKNVSELFRALARVVGKWRLDIYGSVSANTRKRLDILRNDIVDSNVIVYHGFQQNVWSDIHEADVIFLTSKFEGFPMVLIEAASRGVALIASDCPMGPSEIVTPSNGYLYQLGNLQELAKTTEDIVQQKKLLPKSAQTISSVARFGYYNYISKIYKSLDEMNGKVRRN